ncbi:phosphatidylinositol mannoside acyltransferase [Georgenia sunbinii]|uniref:phosphatidylinositol mannoside acyltransferase n=1 Tax=Georgenia sunbinii TaxID=3117728 RepID=UPI002F26D9CF
MKVDGAALLLLAARVVPRLPRALTGAIFAAAADIATLAGIGGVHQLRANLARVVPDAGPARLRRLTRAGMRSYLRYYEESLRLSGVTPAQLAQRVRCSNDGPLREEFAAGRPVVAALGHNGNWDLAGAWATQFLAPVVTVAEHLEPEELFQGFLSFRRSLGMTIIPLEKGGSTFREVLRATLGKPVITPLLADRDLSRGGIEVQMFGEPARVAPGPAALAAATGAPLVATMISYERLRGVRRRAAGTPWGIHIAFGRPLRAPAGMDRADAVVHLTQLWVDELAAAIAEHPEDWHMLQPVFVADADPDRLASVRKAVA